MGWGPASELWCLRAGRDPAWSAILFGWAGRVLPFVAAFLLLGLGYAQAGSPEARADHEIPVAPPKIPAPFVETIPLEVELCLAPELQQARLHRGKDSASLDIPGRTTTGPAWQLGAAVTGTVRDSVKATFRGLSVVHSCAARADSSAAGPVRLFAQLKEAQVLTPRIQGKHGPNWENVPVDELLAWHSTIVVGLSLSAADGAPVEWEVDGRSTLPFALFSKDEHVAPALTAALRNVSVQLIASFYLNGSVRDWLIARGATVTIPE